MPRKDTLQQTIGKFIKTQRKKQEMSLEKLALLSLGKKTYASKISLIEKGQVKGYTVDTLDRILFALGFEMANLFKD